MSSFFDLDRVTKRFYDKFQQEHNAFVGFVQGIPDEAMQRWYVFVMLNRLMFIYFIQKKRISGQQQRLSTGEIVPKQAQRERSLLPGFPLSLVF